MTEEKDTPIKEMDFVSGVKVVNIGDIRVARGLSYRPYTSCPHVSLVYDDRERRVWCKDCQHNIESFDAFKILTQNAHAAYAEINRMWAEAKAAQEHTIHLIATKNIERAWRGKTMAIACPHCRGGLLPEDFTPISAMGSAEIERARRKKLK